MRPSRRSEKKKQWLDAYANGLNISKACAAVGINRQTFYVWTKDDPKNKNFDRDFTLAVGEVEDSFVDICEDKVRQRIMKDEWVATKYFLENRAPHRWKDSQGPIPVELCGGTTLQVKLTKVIDGSSEPTA
jgi:hypothetical protein